MEFVALRNGFENGVDNVLAVSPEKLNGERSLDRCEDDLIRSPDNEDVQSYSEVLVPVATPFRCWELLCPFSLYSSWLGFIRIL